MSTLDRVLGRKLGEATTTGDVCPVVATVPAWRHASRKDRKRKKSGVAGVIGEAVTQEDDEIIPEDAEEAEEADFNAAMGINVRTPREKEEDPDAPQGEEEKLMTPRSALVAPDVTPDSMTEIDPADVPGKGMGKVFRAADLEPQLSPDQPEDHSDPAVSQMDVILGRQRGSPNGPGTPPMGAPAVTEAAAAAMFATGAVGDVLKQGEAMPEPAAAIDSKKVCEAARRWM